MQLFGNVGHSHAIPYLRMTYIKKPRLQFTSTVGFLETSLTLSSLLSAQKTMRNHYMGVFFLNPESRS